MAIAIVEWKCGIISSGRPLLLQLTCSDWGEERKAAWGRRIPVNAAVQGGEIGGSTVELKVFEEMTAKRRE